MKAEIDKKAVKRMMNHLQIDEFKIVSSEMAACEGIGVFYTYKIVCRTGSLLSKMVELYIKKKKK